MKFIHLGKSFGVKLSEDLNSQPPNHESPPIGNH